MGEGDGDVGEDDGGDGDVGEEGDGDVGEDEDDGVMEMLIGGVPAAPGERGRETPSSSSLTFSLDGRRVSPLVHGLHGVSPSEIGSVSLSLSVSAFLILAFHRFLYTQRSVTPIGLKF